MDARKSARAASNTERIPPADDIDTEEEEQIASSRAIHHPRKEPCNISSTSSSTSRHPQISDRSNSGTSRELKLRLLHALNTLREAMDANTSSMNEAVMHQAQLLSSTALGVTVDRLVLHQNNNNNTTKLPSNSVSSNHRQSMESNATRVTGLGTANPELDSQFPRYLQQRRLTAINPFAFRPFGESVAKRTEKVVVEVRVVFLKIGEIDTLKELYHADIFIQTKWRESKLDHLDTEELANTDLSKFWNPLIYIDNILSESKDTQWSVAMPDPGGEVYILDRRRVKGHFMETLELFDFPLDVQDLTVTLTTERPDIEVDLIPDQNELSAINRQTFVDHQEWRLHEHVDVTKEIITEEYSSSMKSHPCISVTCKASRRPGYFYWNVFLIMFFITALSFATFSVSVHKTENRLQLSFTLFLTSVTFKFVINQSLPKISYLTYMDKYVLMSLGMLSLVSLWHALAAFLAALISAKQSQLPSQASNNTASNATRSSSGKKIPDADSQWSIEKLEFQVLCLLIVFYVAVHIIFILWMYFGVSKKRRVMRDKDNDYKTFLQRRREWARLRKRVSTDPTITNRIRISNTPKLNHAAF